MSVVHKYRLRCTTEAADVETWRDTTQGAPTVCPTDPAHVIDAQTITIIETRGLLQPVMIEPTGDTAKTLVYTGRQFDATLSGVTDDNWSQAEARDLQGVRISVQDHTPGDHVELLVVQPGTPEIVLGQYGETVYIPPNGEINVVAEGTLSLAIGLVLRTKYTSVATGGNQPKVTAHYRMWK